MESLVPHSYGPVKNWTKLNIALRLRPLSHHGWMASKSHVIKMTIQNLDHSITALFLDQSKYGRVWILDPHCKLMVIKGNIYMQEGSDRRKHSNNEHYVSVTQKLPSSRHRNVVLLKYKHERRWKKIIRTYNYVNLYKNFFYVPTLT